MSPADCYTVYICNGNEVLGLAEPVTSVGLASSPVLQFEVRFTTTYTVVQFSSHAATRILRIDRSCGYGGSCKQLEAASG